VFSNSKTSDVKRKQGLQTFTCQIHRLIDTPCINASSLKKFALAKKCNVISSWNEKKY